MPETDLFIEAIKDARSHTPAHCPTGGVDAFVRCAPGWPPVRLAQECVRLTAELTASDEVVLHARQGTQMVCSAMQPPQLTSPLATNQEAAHFPWGIDDMMASRFISVENASELPASGGSPAAISLGELDLHSAVHLPLRAGNRTMGAVNLYWCQPGVAWDDRVGALVRSIGVFTLDRVSRITDRPADVAAKRLS